MDLAIRGRVALVCGASAGIGAAVAHALAREGVTLALAARRTDRLAEVAREARALGAQEARGFALDLHDPAAIARALDEVREVFGAVDILIANGGGPPPGTFRSIALEQWDDAYRHTLRGMLQLVYGVVPGMVERRWGRIVALASTSVKQPIAGIALSNALRTALVAALKTLSAEVAPHGVTVNAIATGRVRTARLRAIYGDDEAAARADIPMGRVAEPDEFAPLAAFLCGEPARYVTGQTIAVDGGLTKTLF